MIPECDRSDIDMKFYSQQGNYFIYRFFDRATTRVAPVMASRGCQNQCSFCTARLIWGGEIRYRKASLVVDEMIRMRDDHGINTFTFFDANLWGNQREFLKLANEITKRMAGCRWVSIEGTQVSSFSNPEVIHATCESGCKWFVLPFESGNPETLKRIKKVHSVDVVGPIIENIRKIEGTWISGNLITGFPWETKEDINNSFNYARQLDLDWLYVYRFIPFPGIQMYQESLDAGFTRKYSWNEELIDELFVLNTPQFEAGYVADVNYMFNLEYNFLTNRNIKCNPRQAIRDCDYVLERSLDHAMAMYTKARAYEELNDFAEAEKWYIKAIGVVQSKRCGNEAETEYSEFSMESISKSFVVIDNNPAYGKRFKKAGIDLHECLQRVRLMIT